MEDVLLCVISHENVTGSFVLKRELQGKQSFGARRKAAREVAGLSLPLLNPKKAINFPELSTCDKIFAGCWLDSSNVALGSKDNQLIIWDIYKNTYTRVPIPEIGSDVPADTCGIHDIDVSPTRRLIASGGNSPLDIMVFSRETAKPTCLLKGHSDWVFAAKFLEEDYIASASRDSTVSMWKVTTKEAVDGNIPVLEPLLTRKEHATKVRALGYHRGKKQIATVSADSVVKIWDRSNMDVVATVDFPELPEMVCLAVDETYEILAVGSQRGVCVFDTRGPTRAMTIDDNGGNNQWGIRSVDFYSNFISVGGGYGRLAFYDLRTKRFIETMEGKLALKTGEGYIDNSSFHYPIRGSHHAIYTHKFDPIGGRLLVAGGPIMLGAKGSYAAVW